MCIKVCVKGFVMAFKLRTNIYKSEDILSIGGLFIIENQSEEISHSSLYLNRKNSYSQSKDSEFVLAISKCPHF